MIFRMGENETKIDFAFIENEHKWFMQYARAIPGEFHDVILAADMDRR